jgi:hypothetical protein
LGRRLTSHRLPNWLLFRNVYPHGLGGRVVVLVEEAVEAAGGSSGDERSGF